MEGALSKWTNVMKGWQYRWFVLDDSAGIFSYYTSKEKMTRGVRRGCVRLRGALIGIDDEVSNFTKKKFFIRLLFFLMIRKYYRTMQRLLSQWMAKHFISKLKILRNGKDGLEHWKILFSNITKLEECLRGLEKVPF